jgi:hypothetical protein
MTVPQRAALYLRVSTTRQAEHDISIPDQRRQGEAYCTARGHQLVETYVEPGSTYIRFDQPRCSRRFKRALGRHMINFTIRTRKRGESALTGTCSTFA